MTVNVMVIAMDYYGTEPFMDSLRERFERKLPGINVNVFAAYRVSHAEVAVSKADVVIGSSLCNDYDHHGVAIGVYYGSYELATVHGKPYINTHFAKVFPGQLTRLVKKAAKRKAKLALRST